MSVLMIMYLKFSTKSKRHNDAYDYHNVSYVSSGPTRTLSCIFPDCAFMSDYELHWTRTSLGQKALRN